MKYGETIFDIIYLVYAITTGIRIQRRDDNRLNKKMGLAVLILGIGDAFHLIPRILSYFLTKDLSLYLGIGKLITSITMTIFYVYLYEIYFRNYHKEKDRWISTWIWELLILRIILCLNPENGWFQNLNSFKWGILRNLPFLAMGIIVGFYYFISRKKEKIFKWMWLYILISFLCYIPVVLFSYKYSLVGMLMIPKTICYVFMIHTMNKKSIKISEY